MQAAEAEASSAADKAAADRAAAQEEEAGTFPYSQLQTAPFPDGVDSGKREQYLGDREFQEVFGMDKSAFAALAGWKRSNYYGYGICHERRVEWFL